MTIMEGDPHPMSRTAAYLLAERLEKDKPHIRSENELKLVVAALRLYANSR